MNQKIVDLHVHSAESDGTLTPTELISLAKKQGLTAMALTDHDTIDGVNEAACAAKEAGIELIPGVELSCEYNGKEIHVVGLFIDVDDPDFQHTLADFRQKRDGRNIKMAQKLCEEGFSISQDAVANMFPDAVLTRAHMARYLLETGQIKDLNTAFEKYIGDGCRCYVNRDKISPMEAVRLIRQVGGIAILAHPVLYKMNDIRLQKLLEQLKAEGLTGMETRYATYTAGDTRHMQKLASQYQLLESGGSDFHGSNKPRIQLGCGYGSLSIPYDILEKLKEAAFL